MNRKAIVIVALLAIVGAGYYYVKRGDGAAASAAANGGRPAGNQGGGQGGPPGGGGFGGPGGFGGGGPRLPMTVELAAVKRADMSTEITVVGNLIGAATVEALPKVAGRLERVNVRLGDRVSRGQTIAKIEDQEIEQQVKQQQAAYEVAS